MVAPVEGLGGHAWLLGGWGHAWLLQGGMCGCSRGVCMVALGGMRGCSGGACIVALGGHAWLLWGAVRGCSWGGGHAWDMTRYRDTINEQAVHILLECILVDTFKFPYFGLSLYI